MTTPLTNNELEKLYNEDPPHKLQSNGAEKGISATLLDVLLEDRYEPKMTHKDGRLTVTVDTDAAGLDISHAVVKPELVLLDPASMKQHDGAVDLPGFRPPSVSTSFPPSHEKRVKDKGLDKPAVIFGADDRFVFHDTSFPWRLCGKIQTAVARGSGCMIGPRHVLTASHCVNWLADGKPGWINFTPGYYAGSGPWGTFSTITVYSWMKNSGPLSDQQTAFDYVVLVLDSRIGDTIGWAGARAFDNSWVNNSAARWQNIGYPGDLTGTEKPVYQGNVLVTSKQDFTFNGRKGAVLGHFSDIAAGMSGGPLWGTFPGETFPRVVGVCSTREGPPIAVPDGSTSTDNEFGGGQALSDIITQARADSP